MAETSKVRLVRCPKCENLLPELPDYSVYQCGGCGAVLRAKKGNPEGANGSQTPYEERMGVLPEKSEKLLDKTENFVGKGTVSGVENAEARVSDALGSTESVAQKLGNDAKLEVGKWAIQDGNSSKNELGNGNLDSKADNLETHVKNANGSRRSSRLFERGLSERGEEERFGRIRRGFLEGARYSSSNLVGEGTSKYNLDLNFRNGGSGATGAEYVNPDREELLRKLDELKEQLSRVHNVGENSREKVPLEHRVPNVEPYGDRDDIFHEHPSSFQRVSRQFSAPNKHAAGATYFEHGYEPYPIINRPDIASHNYHNPMSSSNHVPGFGDPFESQMFRRPPRRILSHLHHVTPEPDPFDPHLYNMVRHQLSCSCYQCCHGQPHVPSQIPPTFGNRRFPHVANKDVPCHREVHSAFGPHGCNSKMFNAPMGSCNPQPHSRWPSELNLEMSSFARARPQRVLLANGRRCYPVVGGAPFVTCHNCFELLKLPKKVVYKQGEWKVSCGACSSAISFAIVDEKLVFVNPSGIQSTTEAVDSSEVGHGHVRRDNASVCSEDYANSVYDFQAMDREAVSSSTGQGVSSGKSEEMHNLHSVSATTSEDEHFSDDFVARQGVTFTAEPPEKLATSSAPGSPLQDPFDYTSKYRAVNRCGKGNLSSRSDQERVVTNKSTMRQNSLKESLATEMDISLKDYANNGASQDSTDVCREDDQPKGKKGVDAFLAGIIKKSFRDFSKSSHTVQNGKRNVTVNGHLIPDRLVKKAEKLAGPVYPGQYWYDYRAGFWGVMGGPCLGIIPPCIEEFNHPMPEKCAAGNTGVFVNGRELHQKDLDLLVTRGLPPARNRSYVVEISGRVVDEDSGLELDCLGKLAPTVEKVKHGFGMRVPKTVA